MEQFDQFFCTYISEACVHLRWKEDVQMVMLSWQHVLLSLMLCVCLYLMLSDSEHFVLCSFQKCRIFCACVYKHKFVHACLHICAYVCLSISEFAYCGMLNDWQVLSFSYFGNLRKNNTYAIVRNHVWNIHTHSEMKWIFNIIYKPDYQHRVFVNVKRVVSWLTQIL